MNNNVTKRKKRRRYRSTPKKNKIEAKAVVKESKEKKKYTPRRVAPKKTTTKPSRHKVIYRELVYLGTADIATAKGAVTGKKYTFDKDAYGMPKPVKVDERDYQGVLALKGKGCSRRDPATLFMSKNDWELEIAQVRRVNR